MVQVVYHPDPSINAEITADALAAEIADLEAGYMPKRWICPCGASHRRGHFGVIGSHRCLRCGYAGPDGVMVTEDEWRDAGAEGEAVVRRLLERGGVFGIIPPEPGEGAF